MNLEYEQARELRNALSRQGWGRRDATREVVRIRDNRTCKLCGRQWQFGERRFDVHHLNGICGNFSGIVGKVWKDYVEMLYVLSPHVFPAGERVTYEKKDLINNSWQRIISETDKHTAFSIKWMILKK